MSETMCSARARYHSQLQDSRADTFIQMPVSGFVVNICTVSMLTTSRPKERPMRLSAPFALLNPLRLLCPLRRKPSRFTPLRTNESQSESTSLGGRREGMSLEACGQGGLDSIKWIWKRQTDKNRGWFAREALGLPSSNFVALEHMPIILSYNMMFIIGTTQHRRFG